MCDQLVSNIVETIGCPYDLQIFANKASITQAYEEGLALSQYPICLFIHEDVRLHTKNWGSILIDHFKENSQLGLLGISGSKSKTYIPSAWWDCPEEDKIIRIIQYKPDGSKEDQNQGFRSEKIVEAAILDGVFMALRKESRAHFDQTLTGFHGYDLDISLAVQEKGYKVAIIQDIVLEHFSLGSLHEGWLNAILFVHRKYKHVLPINLGSAGIGQEFKNLIQLFKHYVNLVRKNS
jgi:Glycosyltransferase like family